MAAKTRYYEVEETFEKVRKDRKPGKSKRDDERERSRDREKAREGKNFGKTWE